MKVAKPTIASNDYTNMRRLLLVVVLLQVAMANAFLCDVPVFGWFFRIFLPFLCGDVDGPPTPTSTMAPTSTAPTPTGTLPQGPSDIFVGFDFAGCFLKLVSEVSHTVTGPSINERAVECRNSCPPRTRLFGVVATDCFCYTDTGTIESIPNDRLFVPCLRSFLFSFFDFLILMSFDCSSTTVSFVTGRM